MFDSLVWTVMSYGAEIFGWEGKGEDGEDAGEIFKMDDGGGLEEDARVHNQGGS